MSAPTVTVTPVRGGLLHQVTCDQCGPVATRPAIEDAHAVADRHRDEHRRGKIGRAA